MEPADAANVLLRALPQPERPLTVADASVASGLPLRDAEAGLHWLTQEYRGHLRVTEDGDLVYVFPTAFTKPWETRERMSMLLGAVGGALAGAGRFVVRAWILLVMVGYALVFVALMIGLAFARQGSNDRDESPGFELFGGILRMIADAMFWTFHPFSPVYVGPVLERPLPRRVERRGDDTPFYEKVNRFVFGPHPKPEDPHAMRARVLAEIRACRGRIGLADVMRVTGLPREAADPLMARLMLDYDGTVEVADQGGIVYRFEALRRTARATGAGRAEEDAASQERVRAAWESPPEVAPLTGNEPTTNVGIALLNGFNVMAGAWALQHGLTLENVASLFDRHRPPGMPLPDTGVPIVLGVVPLAFSLALFAMPLGRALVQSRTQARVAKERARLAILREVLARAPNKEPVSDEVLRTAYRVATGTEASSKEITAHVVALGGDVDVGPEGEVRYRFVDLEAEAEALEDERARAPEAEERLGNVVFASDE